MKKYIFSTLLLLATALPVFADSPLTSTVWWEYYKNNAVIVEASESGCTDRVVALLCDDNVPLDLRLSAVNAVGWNINGQDNFDRCLDYCLNKIRVQHNIPQTDTIAADYLVFTPETYSVLAYLKALDDYFEVKEALSIAFQAYQQKPTSKGISMVLALILAQLQMEDDWCGLYRTVATVAYDENLEKDIPDYMVERIMDYINGYQSYCEQIMDDGNGSQERVD